MPFHVVKSKRKDNHFDVANADTGEVKNADPYADEKDAQSYSNALNAHSSDTKKGALKGMYDAVVGGMSASDYAVQESWDICQACAAMSSIAGLISSEKEEPDDVRTLASILRQLNEFISGEIDEMEKAGTQPETMKKIPAQVKTTDPAPAINLAYVKSLGIAKLPEKFVAAKFTGRNEIKHYAFLWGNPEQVDLTAEYFTPETDFWDSKNVKQLTWDHGQDEKFNQLQPNPVIGKTVDFGNDEWGRWAVSVLDTDQHYRKFVDQFIEEGRLGYSSDSAPQYIQREPRGKGVWLKRWPWFAGALTAAPCEPRMKDYSPEFLKSLGFVIPDALVEQERELLDLEAMRIRYSI